MANAPQKRSEPETDAPRPAAHRPPPIDPKLVTRQAEGFVWSEVLVRLPAGMVFGDLIEPGIWRQVQASPRSALKKLDRVSIVDFEESWIATAIVAAATERAVTLSKPVKTELEPRTEKLVENELYRVTWVGNGYRIQRKADGAFVTTEVASLDLAERDLRALYPRAVS